MIRVRLMASMGKDEKRCYLGNTDKLFDAERRWDLKEKGVQ